MVNLIEDIDNINKLLNIRDLLLEFSKDLIKQSGGIENVAYIQISEIYKFPVKPLIVSNSELNKNFKSSNSDKLVTNNNNVVVTYPELYTGEPNKFISFLSSYIKIYYNKETSKNIVICFETHTEFMYNFKKSIILYILIDSKFENIDFDKFNENCNVEYISLEKYNQYNKKVNDIITSIGPRNKLKYFTETAFDFSIKKGYFEENCILAAYNSNGTLIEEAVLKKKNGIKYTNKNIYFVTNILHNNIFFTLFDINDITSLKIEVEI